MSLKKTLKPVWRAGYEERDAVLPDGTILHYGESPANGKPPLLLLHGQTGAWQSYAAVLPRLSERYHVFAVDCHGHGGSAKNPEKYTACAMGADFAWMIRTVIGAPCTVSGHSSGGLLAAWLAANCPEEVQGVVLEDPPFFSTEKGERWEHSFAYVDACAPIHAFRAQEQERDWVIYYLKHALWRKYVGEKNMTKLIAYGEKYRRKHPEKPLHFFFLPESLNRMFWFMDDYDLRFGESFYNSTWFAGYNQEQVLRRITCPAVLLHTRWSVDEDGILLAAMSGEDAARANRLMANSTLVEIDCGHEVHQEKPQAFLDAFQKLPR